MLDPLAAPLEEVRRAGAFAEAEEACREALRREPRSAALLQRLGLLLGAQGKGEEAVALLRAASESEPSAERFATLAVALSDLKRSEEALAAADEALRLDREHAEAHLCRAVALRRLLRFEESAQAFRQVARLRPASADAHAGLAQVLLRDERRLEAEAAARRALALDPRHVPALRQLSNALLFQGRVEEAIEPLRAAWAHAPLEADLELNLGLALLACGRYEEGWPHYEARFASTAEKVNAAAMKYAKPRWNGEELRGKTLVLHAEQGLGDTLQFVRFVPQLLGRGARVVLRANARLAALLRRSFPQAQVTSLSEAPPEHDFWLPLLSLGRLLAITLDRLPGPSPYLSADPRLRERWRTRLAAAGGSLRVGLVWGGNPLNTIDERRSLAIEALAPLASVPGVALYSLQHGPRAAQAVASSELDMVSLGDAITPFEELAAVLCELDLVVTVDTAAAHLAGALGVPCWVLLSRSCDWRWLQDRSDSPWYPSIRLFRQATAGDWSRPVGQAAEALLDLVRRRASLPGRP